MQNRLLEVRRLGRFGYADGLELQKTLETEVIAERKRDYLLLWSIRTFLRSVAAPKKTACWQARKS